MLLIDGDFLQYHSPKRDYLQCIENVDWLIGQMQESTGVDKYRLFLSGGKTFRHALSPAYKATRRAEKPPYFYDIRNYLVDNYNAEIQMDMEADDACGLNSEEDTIICSQDKDLRTIPGQHLILHKTKPFELVYVTTEQAWTNFYVQMLTGDTVDNIEGIKNPAKSHWKEPPNFTEATARGLLSGLSTGEQETLVRKLYNNTEKYELNHKLLWILR